MKGCGDISPVERRVDGAVLESSLRALFAGPTDAEWAGGAASTFGPATAGLLRSVRTQGGSAYVDLDGSLRDRVPKGPDGSDCSNFAEQVGGTLRQFGGIAAVYYAYDGDPADFVTSLDGTCPIRPEPGGLCDSAPFAQASVAAPPSASAISAQKTEACVHVRLAAAEYAGDALRDGVDFKAVEAAMTAAWRAGRTDGDPDFVRNLVPPGAIARGATQTLGDATARLAVLCGLTPTGIKAPAAQRLNRTDEFGAVTGTTRSADGTLQVQVNRVDWLSGDEARAAAAADGTDAGDYYVVDDNLRTRTYDISPSARVYGSIQLTGVPELSALTFADWTRFLSNGSRAMAGPNVAEQVRGTYFHFHVQDGLVVGIEEQYRP